MFLMLNLKEEVVVVVVVGLSAPLAWVVVERVI